MKKGECAVNCLLALTIARRSRAQEFGGSPTFSLQPEPSRSEVLCLEESLLLHGILSHMCFFCFCFCCRGPCGGPEWHHLLKISSLGYCGRCSALADSSLCLENVWGRLRAKATTHAADGQLLRLKVLKMLKNVCGDPLLFLIIHCLLRLPRNLPRRGFGCHFLCSFLSMTLSPSTSYFPRISWNIGSIACILFGFPSRLWVYSLKMCRVYYFISRASWVKIRKGGNYAFGF